MPFAAAAVAMIRPRKIFIIITVLCVWMLATYVLVTNKTQQNESYHKTLLRRIEDLENDVRDKVEERKYLKDQIVSILKARPPSPPIVLEPSGGSSTVVEVETTQVPPSVNPLDVYTILYLDEANRIPVIPVLVFACNRPSVAQALDNLTKYRPNREQFPIIVSQVGGA